MNITLFIFLALLALLFTSNNNTNQAGIGGFAGGATTTISDPCQQQDFLQYFRVPRFYGPTLVPLPTARVLDQFGYLRDLARQVIVDANNNNLNVGALVLSDFFANVEATALKIRDYADACNAGGPTPSSTYQTEISLLRNNANSFAQGIHNYAMRFSF
jgi:hypothetical protein